MRTSDEHHELFKKMVDFAKSEQTPLGGCYYLDEKLIMYLCGSNYRSTCLYAVTSGLARYMDDKFGLVIDAHVQI